MERNGMIDELCMLLLKQGYALKCVSRSCFDIIARGPKTTLLLKVLQDVNALSADGVAEMKRVASMVKAVPLVIGETAGRKLEDGVVYMRIGMYTLSLGTFEEALNGDHPMLLSTSAGVTFSISGERLRTRREEHGFSRKDLSRRLGVSPKMVDKYESDASAVTVAKGMRIYDLFGEDVFNPINLFEFVTEVQPRLPELSSDIAVKYFELGFEVVEVKRVPFDLLARNEHEIIFTELGDTVKPEMQSLAKLIDADNLLIFEKRKPKDKDLPSMKREEFMEIDKAKELVKFLKEF